MRRMSAVAAVASGVAGAAVVASVRLVVASALPIVVRLLGMLAQRDQTPGILHAPATAPDQRTEQQSRMGDHEQEPVWIDSKKHRPRSV
jgi:hypothetical protein